MTGTGGAGNAWCVDFYDGFVGTFIKNFSPGVYVRAVRVGP